jgi:hypothetical protein
MVEVVPNWIRLELIKHPRIATEDRAKGNEGGRAAG